MKKSSLDDELAVIDVVETDLVLVDDFSLEYVGGGTITNTI